VGNYFEGNGLLIDGLVFLSPREALPFLEKEAVLVDLREGLERNGREFKVQARIDLPFRELEKCYEKLPKDRPLILAECTACGVCALFCPEGTVRREDGTMVVDYEHCKGCGICEVVCPVRHALAMEEVVA
jgi:2-oxoacid:acceptor oxidoreductase delta subunit (pyruvate/2-ketoisovalerate family)